MTPRLSTREIEILRLLASGQNPTEIAVRRGVSKGSIDSACHTLRLKTGIGNPRDPAQCRKWLQENETLLEWMGDGPTPHQLKLMRMTGEGMSTEEIAAKLLLSKGNIETALASGLHRARLHSATPEAIRAYFARMETSVSMDDPAF